MEFSIIPGRRIARRFRPELKVYAPKGGKLEWKIVQDGRVCHTQAFSLPRSGEYTSLWLELPETVQGSCTFLMTAQDEDGRVERSLPYEILDGAVPSTTLLDGAFIDIVHWSEDEGRAYNDALRSMTDGQWEELIEDMHTVGMDGVILQGVFDNTQYVFRHAQGQDNYLGKAFYPSRLYPARCPTAASDPIEHILRKADELEMQVFLGVGNYAWFDFSPDSLIWHKRVAAELWEMYGHHRSFYGFYLPGEMMGGFYEEWPEHAHRWTDVPAFCREFAAFIKELAPTKPIALAPNNIRFEENREKWLSVLQYIDILLPFAFARDLEHLNVRQIQEICRQTGTHLWIDLEVFQFPFDSTGLIPKDGAALEQEIRIYDDVENIYGYEYVGHLNNPARSFRLGGEDTVALFRHYEAYRNSVVAKRG